jgi:hypothetical protein
MPFEFKPVKSSQFKAVAYDPATQKMRINFGKSTYEYSNVSQEKHDEFMASDSLGRYFGEHFKKNVDAYPFARLPAEEHVELKEEQA